MSYQMWSQWSVEMYAVMGLLWTILLMLVSLLGYRATLYNAHRKPFLLSI